MSNSVNPANPVSPKVTAAGIWGAASGLLLTGVLAILNAVTPDMLAFLGAWQGVGIALVSSVAAIVAGYIKRDPLRAVPGEGVNNSGV